MKKTKKSLFKSVLALMLCFCMLLGTTFAWFSDLVTSSSNKIQAGNLKVDLELLDKETGNWKSLKKVTDPIFDYDKWEPGYTDVKVFKIENEGNLALKWMARFESEKALSILSDVIDVYVLPSDDELGYPADRDLTGYTRVGTLTQFINTLEDTTNGTLEAEECSYLGIALKMQESAGNEYQGLSLGGAFDIRILATQWTGENESDSFDNQYDKEATYPALFDSLQMSADINGKVDADNKLTEAIVLKDDTYGVVVTIPVGTLVDPTVSVLTLKINKDSVDGNVTLDQTVGYDVVVEGVAEGNEAPITVLMPRVLPKEQTAVQLFHDGNMMQRVYSDAELVSKSGDNDVYGDKYLYDAETGNVTFSLTHFSNVSLASTIKVMVMSKEIVGIEIDLSNPGDYMVDGTVTIPADGNVYIISHTRTDTTTKNELGPTLTHRWHNINPGEMFTGNIVMKKGAKVVLNGVNIRNSSDDALRIEPSAKDAKTYIYIADGTNNWLTGKSGIGFGTYVYADVYVEGNGCLYTTATGWGSPGIGVDAHTEGDGNKMHFNVGFLRSIPMNAAAGIGGGFANQSWRGLALVEINGGTYQCYRGGDAASIGCGLNGHFGDIVINAGTVNCYVNPWTSYGRNLGRGMYAGSCTGIYVSKDAYVYAWNHSSGYGEWVPGDVYVPSGMKQDASIVVNGFEPMSGIASIDAATMYTVGQTVTVNSVTIDYRDVADEVKTSGFTVGDVDMSYGGKKTVTVTYKENAHTVTSSFEINVYDGVNAIVATPKKTVYQVGETPVASDFMVYAITSDGTKGTVAGHTISDVDNTRVGSQTVTITYAGRTTTCTIEFVNLNVLSGDSAHNQYWFDPFQFYVGGNTVQNYKSYTTDENDPFKDRNNFPYLGEYTGANGEKATGFFNRFGECQYPVEGSPSGWYTTMNPNQYGLTITEALPYTVLGISCITGYDAPVVGIGYYIDGDTSTMKYSAPQYFKDLVKIDPGYQGFIAQYGDEGIIANTRLTLSGFEAGSSHTITWVVVFNDGIQRLAEWNVKMKSSFGSDEYFKDDPNKPDVNVVVLSGQSNAAGATVITQDAIDRFSNINYANVYIQYKNVYLDGNNNWAITTKNQNNGFEKYTFGLGGYDSNTFGPEAALAYHLATDPATKGQQWFIVKYAAPGTNLDLHWQNNQNISAAMLNYVEDCVEALSVDYDVYIRSFLWMQGENDAIVGAESCANNYAMNEQNLVATFRARFAKYTAILNSNVAGSGISFITAGIAPAGKDGLSLWGNSSIVNGAKVENTAVWYVPGTLTEYSALYGKVDSSGMKFNPNGGAIYNSAYIDTSLMSTQSFDTAHYDVQSMDWLGTWFGQYVVAMMTLYG